MKIIDLLNKIANGEEVPKKIIYLCDIYELHTIIEFTYYKNGTTPLLISTNSLNDEVEIIEEPKKVEVPKHLSNDFIQHLYTLTCEDDMKCIAHKINEIINYLQHKEKKEEQEEI